MKYALLTLALVALLAASASAATVTYGPSDTGLLTTNWATTVSLQKFDPALGTLNSIKFILDGHVEGTAKFESQDAEPSVVTMDLAAILKLQRPDLSTLVVTIPVVSTLDNPSAWDGVDDFAGTSGKTYNGLTGDDSNSVTTTSAADKALFTGLGSIILPTMGSGASTGSGAGNLLLQFETKASAAAWVTYDYTPVPEPSSLIALMSGIGGLMGFAIRRRR